MLPDVPRLDYAAEQELLRLVRWQVRDRKGELEYDDMLAEAHLKAWEGYLRATATGAQCPLAVAVRWARWGPGNWLRRWYGEDRTNDGHRLLPPPLSLESDRTDRTDPEALALARLEERALWLYLRRRATPRQLEILARYYRDGQPISVIAARLSITAQAAGRIRDDALARCRINPAALETFPRPATDYPRCARGHYLAPENCRSAGKERRRCRLCSNRHMQATRARRQEQRRALPEARQRDPGPSPLSGHPPAETARGLPP